MSDYVLVLFILCVVLSSELFIIEVIREAMLILNSNLLGGYFAGSERNVSTLTLDGVDVMGERLAAEVGYSRI